MHEYNHIYVYMICIIYIYIYMYIYLSMYIYIFICPYIYILSIIYPYVNIRIDMMWTIRPVKVFANHLVLFWSLMVRTFMVSSVHGTDMCCLGSAEGIGVRSSRAHCVAGCSAIAKGESLTSWLWVISWWSCQCHSFDYFGALGSLTTGQQLLVSVCIRTYHPRLFVNSGDGPFQSNDRSL